MILATLLFGSTTAIQWESLNDGDDLSDPFVANVTDFSDPSEINFTLEGPNSINRTVDSPSGDYASVEFNPGDDNSGDYTLKAETDSDSTDTLDLMVDGENPEVNVPDDEYVRNDPEITVEFSDEHTGVSSFEDNEGDTFDNVEVDSVNGFDSCSAGNTCTVDYEIDTSDLSSGDQFTLDLDAEDNVGNTGSGSGTFIFDNNYEGDTPSFSIEGEDGDNNVFMDSESDEKDITVTLDELEDGEQTEIQVSCYNGDDERIDRTDYEDVDEDGFEFTCRLEGDDYAGTTRDIYVEACDEAGNCEESDTETYSFDSGSPFVGSISSKESYSVFNGDFNVSYDVGDDASGVQEIEYFFESSTTSGEGNTVEQDGDGMFEVDTSTLSSGQHTLYFRVRDGVDRWSDINSVEFEFYPNARPRVRVSAPSTYNITAGQSGSLQVTVENTGELFVKNANISASGSTFVNGYQELKSLAPGDSTPVNFDVSPEPSDIGEHTISVQSESPSASKNLELVVRANSEQQESAESKLSTYDTKLKDLNENVSSLTDSGLSQDLNSTLYSNISDFRTSVKEAENFADEGMYYRALSELENIESEYQKAESSFSDVKNQHELNERNQMLKIAGALVFVLALGGGAYFARGNELEIDLDDYQLPDYEGITEKIGEKLESFRETVEEEEEEVEQKFQGFS